MYSLALGLVFGVISAVVMCHMGFYGKNAKFHCDEMLHNLGILK